MLARSALLLAATSGATADNGCIHLATPQTCVKDDTCAWMMLQGQCVSSTNLSVATTESSCCASLTPGTPCDHKTDDLRDGMCLVPKPASNAGVDMDYITRMMHLAGAGYCGESVIKDWNCGPHCSNTPGISDQVHILHSSDALQGFVAWDSVSNAVIVSFRGTVESSIQDWVDNIAILKTYPFSKYPSAAVHFGWWNAWLSLKDDFVAAIQKIASAHNANKVAFTGHSMGASLATLAAMDMKLSYGYDVTVANYESPRPGDHNFMNALSKEVPQVWRVTHAKDMVVHTPPEAFGFYHASTEIYFPKSGNADMTYVVCDGSGEDPRCSNACSFDLTCTSTDDHLYIMGFEMGGDGCSGAAASVVV